MVNSKYSFVFIVFVFSLFSCNYSNKSGLSEKYVFSISGQSGIIYALPDKIPPKFSFLDIDPNNVGIEHIERMKQYDEIVRGSPIPVYVMEASELPFGSSFYTSDPNEIGVYGAFFSDSEYTGFPKEFIFINSQYSAEDIITTYFHEFQHYACLITNCRCRKDSFYQEDEHLIRSSMQEKHAIENEIKASLELEDMALVENSILTVARYSMSTINGMIPYKMASLSIMRGKLFQKALRVMVNHKLKMLPKDDLGNMTIIGNEWK